MDTSNTLTTLLTVADTELSADVTTGAWPSLAATRSVQVEGDLGTVAACGLKVGTGPSWFDVDIEADLLRLLEMPNLPANTAIWARSYRTL